MTRTIYYYNNHCSIFFQVLREPGKPFGFTIVGGKDTDIGKVLIESIQPDSVINSCTIPLKEGDEIIEINKESVLGKAVQAMFLILGLDISFTQKFHSFVEITAVYHGDSILSYSKEKA